MLCFAACSRKEEPTPVSTSTTAATTVAVTKAQEWFRQQARTSSKSKTAARSQGDIQPAINWEQAIYSEEYVVAPFADASHSFDESHKYGYRFLIVYLPADSSSFCTGRISELIMDSEPADPGQAASLALTGTKPLLSGKTPGPIDGFTGSLLVYSPNYEYEVGLAYHSGALQPLSMRIPAPPSPDTCYDYFLVGYDNTGTMVIHDFLYEICSGGIPPVGGGWGGESGGGGSSTGTGPQQIATITQNALKPCQSQVMQGLQASSGTSLLSIVALFSGSDPDYNWVVKNGSNSFGHMGDTSPRFNFINHSVTTTFDGTQMGQSTDIFVACTMLHEAIHAYLIAYYSNALLLNGNGSVNGTSFQGQYPAIAFAYLSNNVATVAASHHTEMAMGGASNGWIGDIAYSLKQYGLDKGYNMPDQFYMNLAWSGLLDTSAFNALSAADKARIKDVIATECYGTDNRGSPATQAGAKACN